MPGQKRLQMGFHADGSHAGAATPMRNAECLVQIDVRNVGAIIARPGQAHLRIQVRAIQINLAAVAMHDGADLTDAFFENAARGWVRDHHGREPVGMRSALAVRSARSILPCGSYSTTSTSMPAMCAEAGFVPCAEEGIRQTLRCGSPRLR